MRIKQGNSMMIQGRVCGEIKLEKVGTKQWDKCDLSVIVGKKVKDNGDTEGDFEHATFKFDKAKWVSENIKKGDNVFIVGTISENKSKTSDKVYRNFDADFISLSEECVIAVEYSKPVEPAPKRTEQTGIDEMETESLPF